MNLDMDKCCKYGDRHEQIEKMHRTKNTNQTLDTFFPIFLEIRFLLLCSWES
jgi:hypothetical protein